ncbi:unnamed protein product [Brassica oleracea]
MSADWGPVIVAVSLFILLSPGLLFQIPARTRVVEFGNMSTSELIDSFSIKGTPLLHTNKGNRERPRKESTGVDVEIDGDDQNGVDGEEDESVNSYGFSVGFEVTEVYRSVVSGQREEKTRRENHEQDDADDNRSPIRHCCRVKNPCFVDAVWDSTAKRAGTAWILNKHLPHHARSGSQIFDNVNSPLMAESLALRNGIEEFIKAGVQSTTVFSDCQTFIRAIVNKSRIKEVYGVLQDIDRLSSLFVSICFQFIPRSQNRETDFLAKQALQAHCCVIPSV